MQVNTNSEKETLAFGQKLATKLNGGDIVLLKGNLGAGKTTLTKGLAAGLGITEEITSPTFTLMNVYNSDDLQLIHIDTYRLKNENELIEIGVEDYLGQPNTICLIEWPEKIIGLFENKKIISVEIKHVSEESRNITLKT